MVEFLWYPCHVNVFIYEADRLVVSIIELSRLIRPTLPGTVRNMLQFIFDDTLLAKYSYKEQKKK